MVSADTQTFIFNIIDTTQEYNTKLVLFCIIFLYLIFLIWLANKIIPFKATRDERAMFPIYKQMSVKFMRVFSSVFLVMYPLIIAIFMYRDFDIDMLINYMTITYTVIVFTCLGIFILFGMDWIMDLLKLAGIDIKNEKGTFIRRKDK